MTTPDDESLFARLQALAADGRARRAGEADDPSADSPRPHGGRSAVVAFGGRHVAVVAVVLVLGLLGASWAVLRARALPPAPLTPSALAPSHLAPSGSHRPLPSISGGPASTVAGTPSPQPIVAHVAGAVVRPGIVRLPPGSRVADALAAAGGLSPEADAAQLNLAAPVADGSQILVGTKAEPKGEVHSPAAPATVSGARPPAGSGAPSGAPLNLNTATTEQLDGLPGVGPVTAEKIVAWRAQHGRFSRVEELAEVDGIGPKTFAQIAPHVCV